MTPDPDRLPIWISIVTVSSMKGPFVIARKPEEVMVGWAVVVFQKCMPGPVTLCARPRPSKRTVAERVEMCMAIVEDATQKVLCFWLEEDSKSYLEPKGKMFYY
jgi:hypothetical protein